MGQCDLVLAHVPAFANQAALDIHVRTKIRYDYRCVLLCQYCMGVFAGLQILIQIFLVVM